MMLQDSCTLTMELFSRRRWTTRSAQQSNMYFDYLFGFVINTTTYHLGRYLFICFNFKEIIGSKRPAYTGSRVSVLAAIASLSLFTKMREQKFK